MAKVRHKTIRVNPCPKCGRNHGVMNFRPLAKNRFAHRIFGAALEFEAECPVTGKTIHAKFWPLRQFQDQLADASPARAL